ncbi:MAG: hypothetical protein K1V70_04680, partial [Alistipes sp.]
MKKVLTVALIGLMTVSCSKGDSTGPASGNACITFAAEAPVTRSYFPGSTGTMFWSSYDNIGAYAFDASGRYLGISDFCGIDAGSVGSN